MVCLRSTKKSTARLQNLSQISLRARRWGGCEMATTNRLPRKIGPRLVQGLSTATSDRSMLWRKRGGAGLGGRYEHQLSWEGTKTAEFKEPGPPVIDSDGPKGDF